MRVVVVTQNDYLYLPCFFRPFFASASQHNLAITEVVILQPFNESMLKTARRMYRFYGPVDFLRQSARYGALRLRGLLRAAPTSISTLAARHGIPCRVEADINAAGSLAALRRQQPDVVLSVGAPQIFQTELLRLPRWGCVNIHTARLPQYRGVLPTFWALYHGDATVGMTIFRMDEAIDKGNVILQEELPIASDETLDSLIRKTKIHEADMAIRALSAIARGDVRLREYEGESSYFSFPTPEQVLTLRRRGRALL